MTSYPFIESFFRNVLSASNGIQGRFHMCPKYGVEINSDQLGEVLEDVVKSHGNKKYPIAIMTPPRSQGRFTEGQEWEKYRGVIFFLTTTYYDGNNQIKAPNKATGTSTHTITEDWHDMKRCAISFIRVLNRVQKEKDMVRNLFRLGSAGDQQCMIDPVSNIGIDRLSGVRLDFTFSLFTGCEMEDYMEENINSITIPVADPHPEHNM